MPLPPRAAVCLHCVQAPPPFERCFCAVDYGFPWDRLISRLKFGAQPELARTLVDLLVAAPSLERPSAFVALPLSDARLAERGYDQAWELARRLGHRLDRPAHARVLERQFDSLRQTRLSRRERLANLRGAFRVRPSCRALVEGAHLALVDDVMTTGATATEAAAALRAAGARRVDLWVVARTPAPPDD
ncbi:MAG: phosphoribosyltransferase family protein [Rubrivivax sp.]